MNRLNRLVRKQIPKNALRISTRDTGIGSLVFGQACRSKLRIFTGDLDAQEICLRSRVRRSEREESLAASDVHFQWTAASEQRGGIPWLG